MFSSSSPSHHEPGVGRISQFLRLRWQEVCQVIELSVLFWRQNSKINGSKACAQNIKKSPKLRLLRGRKMVIVYFPNCQWSHPGIMHLFSVTSDGCSQVSGAREVNAAFSQPCFKFAHCGCCSFIPKLKVILVRLLGRISRGSSLLS